MTDIDKIFQRIVNDCTADYGVLLQCWLGLPGINTKPFLESVIDFLMKKLEEDLLQREEQLVIELTSISLLADNEIVNILRELCSIKRIDESISIRKWRCYLLEDLIDNIDPNSFYSLIAISEFWLQWQDKLDDEIPHLYQGVANNISPEYYYSEENIAHILTLHLEWINKEKKALLM